MLYKLYISKTNPEKKLSDTEFNRILKGFQEIYKEYGVNVIGAWENAEDPLEQYLITVYKDKAHYEEAVAKMLTNTRYIELTEERKPSIESVQVKTLKFLPGISVN